MASTTHRHDGDDGDDTDTVTGVIADRPQITRTTPDGVTFTEFDPAVNQGAHFPTDPSVPRSALGGSTVTVTGEMHFDCPLCTIQRECRVTLEATHLDTPIRKNLGKFGNCETQSFQFTLPIPPDPGSEVAVTLKAERNPPLGSWETDDTHGPVRIQIQTQTQRVTTRALGFVPWLIGGGIAGFSVAELSPDVSRVPATTAGVGAGGLGKVAADRLRGAEIDVAVQFPIIEVIAFTALLGSTAFLINEVTGIFS